MLLNKKIIAAACISASLLTACGGESSQAMRYIKSVETYDTIVDMYNNPNDYLGGTFHMVGTLYPSTDDAGETFYSVYAEDSHGDEGIGVELDWDDFSGFADYDMITVEGKLEKATGNVNGVHAEYLILRCTSVEKRGN